MPASKRQRLREARTAARQRTSQQRIAAYVAENFPDVKAAAVALGVDRVTLWRLVHGHMARGASVQIITALADHSGKPTDYWLGRID